MYVYIYILFFLSLKQRNFTKLVKYIRKCAKMQSRENFLFNLFPPPLRKYDCAGCEIYDAEDKKIKKKRKCFNIYNGFCKNLFAKVYGPHARASSLLSRFIDHLYSPTPSIRSKMRVENLNLLWMRSLRCNRVHYFHSDRIFEHVIIIIR